VSDRRPFRGLPPAGGSVYIRRVATRRKIALALVVATPLVVVALIGYSAVTTGGGNALPVAQGSSGGVFHPVAGAFEPDDNTIADCEDHECLQQAFGNIAYYEGPQAAFEAVDTQLAPAGPIRADCHRIVHYIGSAALARFELNVAKAFASGNTLCASGYYHGILERAFAGIETTDALAEVARSLCTGAGFRRHGFLDHQCRHGLGHGLMIQSGYDLPLSSSICARLQTGWDEVACLGGVFMENATTKFGYRSSWLDDEDPLYPCEVVAAHLRSACYSRAPYRVVELNGRVFSEAARLCDGVPQRWAVPCFRGFGREAWGEAQRNPAKIVSLCRLAGTRQGDCLYGAARATADSAGVEGLRRASVLCSRASPEGRPGCLGGMGAIVGLLYPNEPARRSACARWSGKDVEACVVSAANEVDPSAERAWAAAPLGQPTT
jgi:hypothetical protein